MIDVFRRVVSGEKSQKLNGTSSFNLRFYLNPGKSYGTWSDRTILFKKTSVIEMKIMVHSGPDSGTLDMSTVHGVISLREIVVYYETIK